jgi:hypothetical protein
VPGEAGDGGVEGDLAAKRAEQLHITLQHQVDINVACSLIDQGGCKCALFQQRHAAFELIKWQVRQAKCFTLGDVRFLARRNHHHLAAGAEQRFGPEFRVGGCEEGFTGPCQCAEGGGAIGRHEGGSGASGRVIACCCFHLQHADLVVACKFCRR